MALSEQLRRVLGHPWMPVCAAAIAVALCAPSLWLGLQVDDYILKLKLMSDPPDPAWSSSPAAVFSFLNGDEEITRSLIEDGFVPWWTHPQLKLRFLRPFTGFTHWLDFRVWPDQPWAMHVQSLLWFAGAILAAAVLYRRLLHPAWVTGLAALLFAVDDAHGLPAVWLANRNATVGVLFGLLALIAHDRWRRDEWKPGAIAGPAALLCGLLSGEIALAAGGYLLAYALFLDTGSRRRRLYALVPFGVVGAAWWVAYRVLDFGASHSGVYVDPGAEPALFAGAVIERAPQLLAGQWGLPSNLALMFSASARHVVWWAAVGFMAVIVALVLPLLTSDKVARFFALGMILSLVPACATFPDDRLLFFAGFGGFGLLAQLLAGVWSRAHWLPTGRIRRASFVVASWFLVIIHLVIAPVALVTSSSRVRTFGTLIERAAATLPSDPGIGGRIAVIVNTPTVFMSFYSPLIQELRGHSIPHRTLILGSGIYPTTVSRPDLNVLAIRPGGGYLLAPGSPQSEHEATLPVFHPAYFLQLLDHLYRDATPMNIGERIKYGAADIQITDITEGGRPAEIFVRFDVELEHPSLIWLRWDHGVYVPFTPPSVGDSTVLAEVTVP